MAIANGNNMHIKQYDIKTVYLHGTLNKPVYMEQPEGFTVQKGKDLVCKSNKSIYGLSKSCKHWNEKFDEKLREIKRKWTEEYTRRSLCI